jgi:hypothetical protein
VGVCVYVRVYIYIYMCVCVCGSCAYGLPPLLFSMCVALTPLLVDEQPAPSSASLLTAAHKTTTSLEDIEIEHEHELDPIGPAAAAHE